MTEKLIRFNQTTFAGLRCCKKFYVLLVLLLFTDSYSAQSWAVDGAIWKFNMFEHNIGGTRKGTITLKYVDTFLVQNRVCKKIEGKFRGISYNMYAPSWPVKPDSLSYSYTTYQDSGVIYFGTGKSADTIVNFNAKPGDKWFFINYGFNCNPRRQVTVVDTGRIEINGFSLKTVSVTGGFEAFTFVERLGILDGYLFLSEVCVVDGLTDRGELTCYQDFEFPPYMSSLVKECDQNIVSLLETDPFELFAVYPNPNNGSFQIRLTKPSLITIHDLDGREIFSEFFQNEKLAPINIENKVRGIYVTSVITDSYVQRFKVLKN